jgi:hypothetical protein
MENNAGHQTISRDPGLFHRLDSDIIAIDEAQLLPDLFRPLRVGGN